MNSRRPIPSFRREADKVWAALPIAMLAGFTISSGLFFGGFNSAAGQAVACIVCGSLLVLCLLLRPPPVTAWRRTLPVLVPAGLAFAWLAGAGLLGAERAAPDLVLAGLLSYLAATAALLAGWWIGRRPGLADETAVWLVTFGGLHLLLGQIVRLAGTAGEFGFGRAMRDARFQGLIGNVNVTACIGGTIFLLALSRLLAERRDASGKRPTVALVGWVLAITGTGAAVITTASRLPIMAIVALATALATGSLLAGGGWKRTLLPVLALMVVAGLALAGLVTFVDRLRARFDILGESVALRIAMAKQYLAIATDAPWTGYGPNGFPAAAAHAVIDPRTAQAIWMSNSAHDLPLQLVVAGGLPYLLLLLAAAIGWCVAVLPWLGRCGRVGDWGLAAALALILAVAMIDIVLDVPVGIIVFLFIAGMLWGKASARLPVGVVLAHRPPA